MPTTISGSTGVTFPAGGLANTAGAGVGTTDTQTLTNKTLTSPTVNSPTIGGTPVMGASVITSGTAVASTSGTSISFTNIPSWVKRITVMFNNVGTSDAAPLLIRLGSGSTTSTGYVSTGTYGNTSNTFSNVQNTTGFYIAKAQIIDRLYALYTIGLLDAATNTWSCSGSFAGSSATVAIGWTAGGVSLAGTLDRVVITSTGGTGRSIPEGI